MRRVLLFIVLFLIIAGGVWFFFIRQNTGGTATNPVAATFKSLFPSGNSDTGATNDIVPDTAGGTAAAQKQFSQISTFPVAGYSIFSTESTITLPNADPKLSATKKTVIDHFIRFVSRANGYVYEIKNGGVSTRISNIFIPNIYEAVFADNNNTALLRFLRPDDQTIATYSVPIPSLNTDGTRTQKQGTYFSDSIDALAVNPASTNVAYLIKNQNGAIVSTVTTGNLGKKDIFRSPFSEWILSWPATASLYIQTKAAATVNGYLYRIDQAAGRLRRVVGNVAGLTTSVSPSGTYVLYSQSTQGGFTTKLFNTKTGATTNLSLAILPEKCAWFANEDLLCAGNNVVPEGVYPDSWYAGLTHFQDELYRISTTSNTYTVVYDGTDKIFDMTNLKLDEGQNILYFIDKTTGILWSMNY